MCIIHSVKIYSKPKNYKLYNKTYKNKLKGENMKKTEILNLSDSKIDDLIKIKGTKFDRGNKLTDTQINSIKNAFAKGTIMSELGEKYNVSPSTIKYHLDAQYKAKVNSNRSNYAFKQYSSDELKEKLHNRAQYKRSLIINNKIKLSTIGA